VWGGSAPPHQRFFFTFGKIKKKGKFFSFFLGGGGLPFFLKTKKKEKAKGIRFHQSNPSLQGNTHSKPSLSCNMRAKRSYLPTKEKTNKPH